MAIFVFFINPDGPHPGQIKKKPLHGRNNFFSGFRAKKGQKRVAGQHGQLRFFVTPKHFFFISIHLISIWYLGGFTDKISAQNVKKKI